MKRTMQEIMERAIGEMREALARKQTKARRGIGTRMVGRKR